MRESSWLWKGELSFLGLMSTVGFSVYQAPNQNDSMKELLGILSDVKSDGLLLQMKFSLWILLDVWIAAFSLILKAFNSPIFRDVRLRFKPTPCFQAIRIYHCLLVSPIDQTEFRLCLKRTFQWYLFASCEFSWCFKFTCNLNVNLNNEDLFF